MTLGGLTAAGATYTIERRNGASGPYDNLLIRRPDGSDKVVAKFASPALAEAFLAWLYTIAPDTTSHDTTPPEAEATP